jgi:glycosyltransferase involved in cell wall biosynthesis
MPIRVTVVIPALDEERSLPLVLDSLKQVRPGATRDGRPIAPPGAIVVDNGSRDGTAAAAGRSGATVLHEPRRGYGRACLRGLAHLAADPPDIVVFLDADFSDDPAMLTGLVLPIADGDYDFVLGSRLMGECEPGALPPHARYGNALAVRLMRVLYGFRYTDLGPFRAIRWSSLASLKMRDPTFGWTAEMQVKALRAGLRVKEVPVAYRRRVGVSKITGTFSGAVKAGAKILWTIARHRFTAVDRPGVTSQKLRE